jgi:hypothetical protein
VWHASVSAPGLPARAMRRLALKAVRGVGDPAAEWHEARAVAHHVRRRLTACEAEAVGPVRDLRGTPEGWARWAALRSELPRMVWPLAIEELGEEP